MPRLVLPTFYYHSHFIDMLASVTEVYRHVLNDVHRSFINRFHLLTKDEQCLYVRVANRKGYIFHRSVLQYAEINPDAYQGLLAKKFVRPIEERDYGDLLNLLTKESLQEFARRLALKDVRGNWTKPQWVEHFLTNVSFEYFQNNENLSNYVVQLEAETVEFLLYLYFGKTHDDLKSFTLRDLQIVRTNESASLKSRFSTAIEARTCFYYSQLLKKIKADAPNVYARAIKELRRIEDCPSEFARRLKSKVALKTGQFFEKQRQFDTAMSVYALSDSHECNERLVRLEYSHGDKELAKQQLERMIQDPASDDEYSFATDFYARKFKGQKSGTCLSILRNAESIIIDDIYRGFPEQGAKFYFQRDGWKAYYTENDFWQSLFGLLFWDELFATGEELHSGFDYLPQCLKTNTFAEKFKHEIALKLDAIRTGTGLKKILQAVSRGWRTPNGLFNWHAIDMDAMRDLFECADPHAVANVIELMCGNYYQVCDGFPDLMLIGNNALRFLEVKAEGDIVRRNQLTRLRQLRDAGFEADIIRVSYRYDPNQTYVVVDIETTGGRAATERVTELGAVKIQNNQMIEEWHSLINPQRRIPQSITALTGITNEMVRDAPTFGEVADSFLRFMGDAVFVAHNVNFDYGFLAQEYQRLEKVFRYPKFCTVSGMRRFFPGEDSYKLESLCERFDIRLERHHRAMHDARAAMHLLSMINARRDEIKTADAININQASEA